ncbi:GreA/GreB family elongation factor [Gilvimarinus agarilyticus]|nr:MULTISPECIES: GreA/GreB family elongation factor [unclassified Gilvimarinus]MBU2886693.1 GreA/GreB family elongation factor [Gilvimarinus agarilyticus]MDO6571360.1 GreA/GreB family elongation factor [Gilvimarinus sp. 2_MG-2023]MDO6746223.1 GreA/GreB family elongation factor [Gilvimarinus sp. 1_MG-2023]
MTLTTILDDWQPSDANTPRNSKVIGMNAEVTLLDLQEKEIFILTITTPADSQPEQGIISCLSPLGAALLNKKVGDLIAIPVLGSQMRYRVITIKP